MDCKLQDELSVQIEKKLTQISAVRCALDGVAKDVMFNHIGHCVKEGLQNGDYEKTVDNLIGTVGKYIRSK